MDMDVNVLLVGGGPLTDGQRAHEQGRHGALAVTTPLSKASTTLMQADGALVARAPAARRSSSAWRMSTWTISAARTKTSAASTTTTTSPTISMRTSLRVGAGPASTIGVGVGASGGRDTE